MALLNCLIPIFNSAPFLEETLESIQKQTFKDFEILAYNDGSQDDSLKILERVKKKEKRLVVFSGQNPNGIPHALNFLMKKSKSKFFAFHGDHDLSHPERFEKQMLRMKNSSLVALGSSIQIEDIEKNSTDHVMPNNPKAVLLAQVGPTEKRGIWFESALYSKKILSHPIEFEETMPALYDILFNAQIQHFFPLRLSNLKESLYTMRLDRNNPYYKVSQGIVRIDAEQIENFFIKNLLPIYFRYFHDIRLCDAVNPY